MTKKLTMTVAMAAALLALPACSSDDDWNDDVVADRDTAVCVDQNGVRVDDAQCAPQTVVQNNYHGGGMGNAFLWYYIGRNSAVPYYGDSVREQRFSGGSYRPSPNTHYEPAPLSSRMTRSAAVSRGGLGRSGSRFGGGRS